MTLRLLITHPPHAVFITAEAYEVDSDGIFWAYTDGECVAMMKPPFLLTEDPDNDAS